ncbi:unnamed protein product [Penicillium pancosmium]
MAQQQEMSLHLVGVGVTHSIAPNMHNYIAKSLGLPWTFYATECTTTEELLNLARNPKTAGLVVTMPYKGSIMEHLDERDELASIIGACNNVYYKNDSSRRVCGTNTDWRGIKGCLLEKGEEKTRPSPTSLASALIIGAGGASRAAVYALTQHLYCPTIYVLNRDDEEVVNLIRDSKKLPNPPSIVHVKTIAQAEKLPSPYYIVGTVPDLEPKTETEIEVASVMKHFLSRPEKGVLLDIVEGTHVIGYQIEEQWRLWAGEEACQKLDREGAWDVLLKAAEESKGINF